MSDVNVTIDGKKIKIAEGTLLLKAIRELGIDIPTLCYHEGLTPYGSCRLCMVAITNPQRALVASCNYLVEEGLVVETRNEEAIAARRMVLEFLLTQCPNSEVISNLASKEGISQSRFSKPIPERNDDLCMLCGLCVRVCRDVIGAAAIGFIGRGIERRVSTPFDINSDKCIGCGACAEICPTGAIKIEDQGSKRILHTWNTIVELHCCPDCGEYFAPDPTEFLKGMLPEIEGIWGKCPKCRQHNTARQWVDYIAEKNA